MLESILTISITGFIAGFIFAMPIAGPISILIVSNALKGRLHYANRVNLGAAIADILIIFIAVYGVTRLYSWYKPAIPFLFIVGSVFFLILGIKIFRKPVDVEQFEEKSHMTEKIKNKEKNGFYTGFMINILNPTLLMNSLISSFFVISLIAALGLNTGGLEMNINDRVKEFSKIEGTDIQNSIPIDKLEKIRENSGHPHPDRSTKYSPHFQIVISIFYAFFLSMGGLLWFYLLSYMLVRYRKMINMRILTLMIKVFGIFLGLLGIYFGYHGIRSFF